MAKKAAKPKSVEASPAEEADSISAHGKAADGSSKHGRHMPATKTEAVRMAIAAGFGSPQVGSGYIQSQFGMDVSPQHFSSTKSQLKTKELEDTPARKSKADSSKDVEGYVALPAKPAAGGEEELLAALEAMKPLVASLGAEKVKRLADLLG